MNYYEHHLGDWAAATGHLTWDEDMAYTRLLRAYYHHEKAIPDGQQYRLAKASTPGQRKAVDQVLSEFFELHDGHYHQKRADAEISRYQDKQRKAKASAEARWSQSARNANASPDAMRTHSEGNALQTPDTSYSVSNETGGQAAKPLTPDEIIFGYGVPLLVGAGNSDKAARSFLGGLRKAHGDERLIDALRECLKAKPLQPLEWLAAKLPPAARSASKHSGFAAKNYHEGVNPDGSF